MTIIETNNVTSIQSIKFLSTNNGNDRIYEMRVRSAICILAFSVLATVLVSSTAIQPNVARAETIIDEIDCSIYDCSSLYRGFEFNTESGQGSIYSEASMAAITYADKPSDIKQHYCKDGLKDPQCLNADYLKVIQSFAFCDKEFSYDCIETFEIVLESGEVIRGNLIGSVNSVPDQSGAIPIFGPFIPDNLLRFDFNDSEVEFYQLKVWAAYSQAVGIGRRNTKPALERLSEFVLYGGDDISVLQIGQFPRSGKYQNPYKCIPIDGSKCWAPVFDNKLRTFRLVIRRSGDATYSSKWKRAALGNPKISFKTVSGARPNVMTVEASQIAVPALSANFDWNDKDQRDEWTKLNKALAPIDRWESRPWCGGPLILELEECPKLRGTFLPHSKLVYPNGMYVPDAYDLYKTLVANVPRFNMADHMTEQFFLLEQPPWNISWNGCSPSQSFGLSSSNSLAIKNGLPTWDPSTNSIVIEAVAPHFASPENIHRGTFSIVMGKDLAICLWGKDSVNSAKVEISIYDDKGNQKSFVAASKVSDNIFSFNASGFTYSTAKIAVTLKQLSKFAVRCKKIRTIKTFEAQTPKCPKGWSKISSRKKR